MHLTTSGFTHSGTRNGEKAMLAFFSFTVDLITISAYGKFSARVCLFPLWQQHLLSRHLGRNNTLCLIDGRFFLLQKDRKLIVGKYPGGVAGQCTIYNRGVSRRHGRFTTSFSFSSISRYLLGNLGFARRRSAHTARLHEHGVASLMSLVAVLRTSGHVRCD